MILTVAFGKGGTGKSSTVCALANYARMQKRSVLVIDCDPQANSTYSLGGNAAAPGLFSVLTGKQSALNVIQHTSQADIISSGLEMAMAEKEISRKKDSFLLKKAIAQLRSKYDIILLDTQPAVNVILINALAASDSVLLPMKANSFSVMGLYQMRRTIEEVRAINPALSVAGILLVEYKPRQTLAADLRTDIEQQAQAMGTKVFSTYIHSSVAVEQAQAMQQSLFEFAPSSKPAKDYAALYEEMNL